jgi:hypothetical protein
MGGHTIIEMRTMNSIIRMERHLSRIADALEALAGSQSTEEEES